MNPFSQPRSAESMLLSHFVYSPRRRIKCGELVDVFRMKPDEFPGRKTPLRPEISLNIRKGLARLCRSSDGVLEETLERL